MIEGKEYTPDDLHGVVACLKRNFEWMGKEPDEVIEKWFSALANHSWNDEKKKKNRYNSGKVLIEDGRVVGYLGGIGAERVVGDRKYLFLNLTTWAVDRGIRGGFFALAEDMYEIPDVVTDLTPNEPSVMFGNKFFGMDIEENGFLRLYPIPYTGHIECEKKFIQDVNEIDDYVIKKEYVDHRDYKDIGLIRIEDSESKCYLFYRKMFTNGNWIRILKVSNPKIFTKHCHEIVWSIFEKEIYYCKKNVDEFYIDILRKSQNRVWIAMECEKRYLSNYSINYPVFTEVKKKRLYKSKAGIDLKNIDFLYTEYSFLV